MITLTAERYDHKLKTVLHQPLPDAKTVALWWLGQAGFVLAYRHTWIVIDPYLSDSLAQKYRGQPLPHLRMMAPPILPDELTGIQAVLCTHRHTDHMDPETLTSLLRHNPLSRVVIPKAEQDWGRQIGIPASQLYPVNAGDCLALNADVSIEVIPSAHEELKCNVQGGTVLCRVYSALWANDDLSLRRLLPISRPGTGIENARDSSGIVAN